MKHEAETVSEPITNEAIWGKLLEIEGFLAGRGTDLLTPNQVYRFYQVTQYRLDAAIEAGQLKIYDNARVAEGGHRSYKVRRSEVIRAFNLPPLQEDGEESNGHSKARRARRAKVRS